MHRMEVDGDATTETARTSKRGQAPDGSCCGIWTCAVACAATREVTARHGPRNTWPRHPWGATTPTSFRTQSRKVRPAAMVLHLAMTLRTRQLHRPLGRRSVRRSSVPSARAGSRAGLRPGVTVTSRCGAILLVVLLTFAMSPSWCCCALRQSLNGIGSTVAQAHVPPCCAARVASERSNGEGGDTPICPKGGSNGCPCKVLVLKSPCAGLGGTVSTTALTLTPSAFAFVAIPTQPWSSRPILDAEALHWRHGPPRVPPDPVSTHCKIVV